MSAFIILTKIGEGSIKGYNDGGVDLYDEFEGVNRTN
jgi:hypothetical protein